ncbi:MAG: GGDEF domain-containing protein [Planctomycetota bacterium]
MGDGLRTIRIATTDASVLSGAKAAIDSANESQAEDALAGWNVEQVSTWRELVEAPPAPGDVLLVDSWLKDRNVYELLRQLSGRTKCRTFVVVEDGNHLAEPIARFCGATGVVTRPVNGSKLRSVMGLSAGPRPSISTDGRGQETAEFVLPEAILAQIAEVDPALAGAVRPAVEENPLMKAAIDPVTGLFNYSFLAYKLDEEFKRARRFNAPLAVAMLGFESQASDDVLRELSAIFLAASRDTDVLGRFDENSFLFLLPNTGPDGAEIMARRVADTAEERRLMDLVGDRIEVAIGIANYPSPDIERREDLYAAAREAFLDARHAGGGVVVSAL